MGPPRAFIARSEPLARTAAAGQHHVEDVPPGDAVDPCYVELAQGGNQRQGIPTIGTRGEVDDKDVLELKGVSL